MIQNALPMHWRKFGERYSLKGTLCETCGEAFFPGIAMCPNCRRKGSLLEQEMPRTGKIISHTKVFVGPTGFEIEAPYALALIELENKTKVLSQIVDSDDRDIKIGAKVKKMFRRIQTAGDTGTISYGYKFKILK